MTFAEDTRLNRLASARMESGIALLESGASEALHEAIRFFDEAIELRRRLPLEGNPGFRYGLAAGWINRGDALTRLGGAANLKEAVTSYTKAIELLKDPPADDDGSFVRRLAIAWMNRGIALEEQKCEEALTDAIHSYKQAVELLNGRGREAGGKLDVVLASAWINLGNALLRSGGKTGAAEASGAAEEALGLLAERESTALAAAEAGLKARHILCQAITALVEEAAHDDSTAPDLINKMTDAIEEALSLVQCWERAGVTLFRSMATQFFHLGALVYGKHQSHFLAEYLLDYLDPKCATYFPYLSESWLAVAEQSLSRARRELRNFEFATLATPQGIRRLERLAEVRAAEERIRMLRCAAGPLDLSCVREIPSVDSAAPAGALPRELLTPGLRPGLISGGPSGTKRLRKSYGCYFMHFADSTLCY